MLKKFYGVIALTLLLSSTAHAVTMLRWNTSYLGAFTGYHASNPNSQPLSGSDLSLVGVTRNTSANASLRLTDAPSALDPTKYIEFTVTPDAGNLIYANELWVTSDALYGQQLGLRSSQDSFASYVGLENVIDWAKNASAYAYRTVKFSLGSLAFSSATTFRLEMSASQADRFYIYGSIPTSPYGISLQGSYEPLGPQQLPPELPPLDLPDPAPLYSLLLGLAGLGLWRRRMAA